MDKNEYPVTQHLQDLRKSIVRALVGIAVTTMACLMWADNILWVLRRPMEAVLGKNGHFVVLVPHEYFFTQVKAALFGGIFLASPWLFYQLWRFVSPGLHKHEARYAISFVVAAAFFFVSGASFAYWVVFPPMFQFFIGTLPADIQGNYSVGMLFGFATNMLLAFGLVFEAPVIVLLLGLLRIVEVESLVHYRRHMIVIAFIVAAVVTPTPDPLTQTAMAVPMILLYELGILATRLILKRLDASTPRQDTEQTPA